MSPVAAKTLDFSNVKESTGINPKHLEDGEYLAKVVSVTEMDAKDGTAMWLFLITPNDHRSATYPYYCKLQENQLWKVRNLFISAGLGSLVAGKSKTKVNPNKVVGKAIGIVLEEEEYEGKMKSVIEAVMPATDLEDGGINDDPEIGVDEDDEDEVVEAPTKKRKAAPVVEEEDEEEEEEAPAPKRKAKKAKAAPVVEEEDDEEEEEEVAPPKRKAKAKPAPVEEEDEDDEDEEDAPVSKRTAARRAAKKAASKKAAPAADEDDEDDELDLDDI